MRNLLITAAAAALLAGCAHRHDVPDTPVYAKGEASPELLDRVDRGEFKAYEVDPTSCAANAQPDRRHETIGQACPSKP